MNAHNPSSDPVLQTWNKILGWTLCVVGVLVFWIALGTVLWTSYTGIQRLTLPGSKNLQLKKPGIYVGVYQQGGSSAAAAQDLSRLQIELSDSNTGAKLPLVRLPPAQVYSVGGRAGVVLFQTEVQDPGLYFFSSYYADGGEGPSIEALLVHESVQTNRGDLTVGVVVCLVLCGFGLYTLIRAWRAEKQLPPPDAGAPPKKGKK